MTVESTLSTIGNDVAEAGSLVAALDPASPVAAAISKVLSIATTVGSAVTQLGTAHASLASDVSTVANTVNEVASTVGNESAGLVAKVNSVASTVETVAGAATTIGEAADPSFFGKAQSFLETRLATLEAAFERLFPSVLSTTVPPAPPASVPPAA